jgi:hypothetical protein
MLWVDGLDKEIINPTILQDKMYLTLGQNVHCSHSSIIRGNHILLKIFANKVIRFEEVDK